MKIYLVGGAVRDEQLNLTVKERDWLVTGASTAQMLALGYTQIDSEFPVFRHPETAEEYALARTEKKSGKGYKGFDVKSGPGVTLEQDLVRRDLTINAMAKSENGQIIDPFNGLEDLREGKLQHITDAYADDPVRLLRTARFASVLGEYGFTVSHATFQLMKKMSVADELEALKPDRILREMNKALAAGQPWRFFTLLGKSGALDILLPGVNSWINDKQMQHGKASESIRALQRVTPLSTDITVRLAVTLYRAISGGGFELEQYLPLDKNRQQLLTAIKLQPSSMLDTADASYLLGRFKQLGVFRQSQCFDQLMTVLTGIFPDRKQQISRLIELRDNILLITSERLIQQGFTGKQLGLEIDRLRMQAIVSYLKT